MKRATYNMTRISFPPIPFSGSILKRKSPPHGKKNRLWGCNRKWVWICHILLYLIYQYLLYITSVSGNLNNPYRSIPSLNNLSLRYLPSCPDPRNPAPAPERGAAATVVVVDDDDCERGLRPPTVTKRSRGSR